MKRHTAVKQPTAKPTAPAVRDMRLRLELDEAETKDLTLGLIPERVADECRKALDWLIADEDGYPKGFKHLKSRDEREAETTRTDQKGPTPA